MRHSVNWVWSVCGCMWPGGALCAVRSLSKRTRPLRRAPARPISILPAHRTLQQMGPSSCCRYRMHACMCELACETYYCVGVWHIPVFVCWQLPTATQNVCGCCSVVREELILLMLQKWRDSTYELMAYLRFLLSFFKKKNFRDGPIYQFTIIFPNI